MELLIKKIFKNYRFIEKELPKLRKIFPEILEDPQVLGVTELADSSINMRVIVKTETEKHYGVERAIRQEIKRLLEKMI